MRAFSAVLLILLLAWNSVLGGYEALLCLHPEGDAHMELVGPGEPHAAESGCSVARSASCLESVDSCTDLLIGSADTGPFRSNELETDRVLAPAPGSELHWLAETTLTVPEPQAAPAFLVDGSPCIPFAPQISRTTVLRL